jgi:benzoate membrane transport protein
MLIGISGVFERLVQVLPPSVMGGMMAGILSGSGPKAAVGLSTHLAAMSLLIVVFAICAVSAGRSLVASAVFYEASLGMVRLAVASPQMAGSLLSTGAMLSLALLLLITTLIGQYFRVWPSARQWVHDTGQSDPHCRQRRICGGRTDRRSHNRLRLDNGDCAGPDRPEDSNRRYIAGVACLSPSVWASFCRKHRRDAGPIALRAHRASDRDSV